MRWLLIDKITEMVPGEKAVGIKCFTLSESFFIDHFPGFPIVPGVLQIEMIAQLGGRCIMAAEPDFLPVLTSVKCAAFRKSIEPGDKAYIFAEVTKRKSYSTASGWIEVDGTVVSSADIMYGHLPISEHQLKTSLVDTNSPSDIIKKSI